MKLFILLLTLQHLCWGLKALDSTSITSEHDANHTILKGDSITNPGCQEKCGNLRVPYPFGINSEGLSCSKDSFYDITCDDSTNPPKPFISNSTYLEVYDISDSELRISNVLAYNCYDTSGNLNVEYSNGTLEGTPYMYSEANVLTVVGCDNFAFISNDPAGNTAQGCFNTCRNNSKVTENECSGGGCCQVSINIQQYFELYLDRINNISSFSSCGYAFFGERSRFKFKGLSDLQDPDFRNKTMASVPIVLDWVIGMKSCTEAYQDSNSYACKDPNSHCIPATRPVGYRCSCKDGYEGNPYITAGCKDIDECERQTVVVNMTAIILKEAIIALADLGTILIVKTLQNALLKPPSPN